MRDHEIIELYWARNESAITATAEKYGNYCHMNERLKATLVQMLSEVETK